MPDAGRKPARFPGRALLRSGWLLQHLWQQVCAQLKRQRASAGPGLRPLLPSAPAVARLAAAPWLVHCTRLRGSSRQNLNSRPRAIPVGGRQALKPRALAPDHSHVYEICAPPLQPACFNSCALQQPHLAASAPIEGSAARQPGPPLVSCPRTACSWLTLCARAERPSWAQQGSPPMLPAHCRLPARRQRRQRPRPGSQMGPGSAPPTLRHTAGEHGVSCMHARCLGRRRRA